MDFDIFAADTNLTKLVRAGKADMHMHSCYSDGSMEPRELVARYAQNGYSIVALTDHDTVLGVPEMVQAGSEYGILVVPGIELSTESDNGVEMHILGYGMDIEYPAFSKKLQELMEKRQERNLRLIEYFCHAGYQVTEEELLCGKKGGYIGKPDFARAFARKGYVQKPKDAFAPGVFLESAGAAAIKKVKLLPEEAVSLIVAAGGMAAIAHPMKIKALWPKDAGFLERLEPEVVRLAGFGLGALECVHRDHTEEQARMLEALAAKLGLVATGGSDFHGDDMKK